MVSHLAPVVSTGKVARIQVVDALRGFALLGILLVHVNNWFNGGPLPDYVHQAHHSPINEVVQTVISFFFSGNFYTLFSFLFGLSFALMFIRSNESEGRFLRRFAWRLIILGAIGFVHHLHWRNDILSIYAMLGFPLLLFRKAPYAVLLTVAAFLILNGPMYLHNFYNKYFTALPSKAQRELLRKQRKESIEANFKIVNSGSYLEVVQMNLNEFETKMDSQIATGRIYMTLGFFLLGLYAGRRRFFQHLSERKAFYRRITWITGFVVLSSFMLSILVNAVYVHNFQHHKVLTYLLKLLFSVSEASLTIFYIAGLTLLFQKASWRRIASALTYIGKMALTNYVMQSVIGTLIFYDYGLGLIGEISNATAAALTIPIFLVQVLFSRWWLSRFRYGPLEWLWRSLTFLKVQPLAVRAN